MDHREIRALRGSLSRAAFARRLGVSALTVLRWELPEDSKEARRPRPRMVEALRRLAQEDAQAGSGPSSEPPDAPSDRTSNPTSASGVAADVAPESGGSAADGALVLPLLARLMGESWVAAEDELFSLLSSKQLESAAGRALAALGLVQVQLIARLDVRGALTALTPILDEVERSGAAHEVAGAGSSARRAAVRRPRLAVL